MVRIDTASGNDEKSSTSIRYNLKTNKYGH